MNVMNDGAFVGMSLQSQAKTMASRLGHHMTGWAQSAEQIFVATCIHCNDVMTVAARRFRAAPISGPAVRLQCRPAATTAVTMECSD